MDRDWSSRSSKGERDGRGGRSWRRDKREGRRRGSKEEGEEVPKGLLAIGEGSVKLEQWSLGLGFSNGEREIGFHRRNLCFNPLNLWKFLTAKFYWITFCLFFLTFF